MTRLDLLEVCPFCSHDARIMINLSSLCRQYKKSRKAGELTGNHRICAKWVYMGTPNSIDGDFNQKANPKASGGTEIGSSYSEQMSWFIVGINLCVEQVTMYKVSR